MWKTFLSSNILFLVHPGVAISGYILNSCSGTGVIDRLMNSAQITDEKPPSNTK